MTAEKLTIALAKGRLADHSVELLQKCGAIDTDLNDIGRKLVFEQNGIRLLLVKPTDVPTYVERGVADMGIVGKDTLMESGAPLYEMLDLGFGACRLCIAGFPESQDRDITAANKRVATKYPAIARELYGARSENVDIIKLSGSVELAPILGLSDEILDVVETGSTLRENGLVVLEEICRVSARLVVNRVSLKAKGGLIRPLIDKMAALLEESK
jgi:ATP phosphoribosyltransferase